MKPPRVHVHVAHDFAQPLAPVFTWLTDYEDDDPDLVATTLRKRRVVERSATSITLEEELELGGIVGRGVFEVQLHPPARWDAAIVRGAGRGSRHTYRLAPTGAGCRLYVTYRIQARHWRTWLRLLSQRRALRLQLERLWAELASAMDAEAARRE